MNNSSIRCATLSPAYQPSHDGLMLKWQGERLADRLRQSGQWTRIFPGQLQNLDNTRSTCDHRALKSSETVCKLSWYYAIVWRLNSFRLKHIRWFWSYDHLGSIMIITDMLKAWSFTMHTRTVALCVGTLWWPSPRPSSAEYPYNYVRYEH